MRKRVLSLLMALAMCLSIWPASVLALEVESVPELGIAYASDALENSALAEEVALPPEMEAVLPDETESIAEASPADARTEIPAPEEVFAESVPDDIPSGEAAAAETEVSPEEMSPPEIIEVSPSNRVSIIREELPDATTGVRLLAEDTSTGDGTEDDPYLISTEDELISIAGKLDSYYLLLNDIVLTSENWTPIGTNDAFTGTFDGDGHTISGLNVSGGGYSYSGLFGRNSGTIKNLTVDGTVSGNDYDYAGILAGYNNGTVSGCFTSGNVSGSYAGGLIGSSDGSVTVSASTATVNGSYRAGGLIGSSSAPVTNCYAQGDVTGGTASYGATGGLLGGNSGTVRNCYSSSKVNNGSGGGLIGNNDGGSIYNSYYRSTNTGNKVGFGTALANLKKQSTFYFWDFDNIWAINDGYPYLDIRGEEAEIVFEGDGVSDEPYLVETEQQLYAISVDLTVNQPQTYYLLANDVQLTTDYWTPIGAYNSFQGTFDGNGHTISGLKVSGSNYSYSGLFGRNSGTIKNLTVTGTVSGSDNAGILLGYNSGTVTGCFTSGNVSGSYAGGLIGSSGGSVTVSASTASVDGSHYAGGLIGSSYAPVTNCYAQGDVTGGTASYGATGGLLGGNSGTVRNCYSSSKVNNGSGGGLIGNNDGGSVYNSYYRSTNTGNKVGFGTALANLKKQSTFYFWDFDNIWAINDGYPYLDIRGEEAEIVFEGDGVSDEPYLVETEQQLYAVSVDLTVNQSQTYYLLANDIQLTTDYWTPIGAYSSFQGIFDGGGHTVSGLKVSGSNYSYTGLFGGNSGTIKNLTVDGTVSGNDYDYAGILAGYNNGTVSGCFTSGNVSGSYAGGLIGSSDGSVTVSASTATVNGSYRAGGLIGFSSAPVTNCYAQGNVVGGTASYGTTGGLIGYNSGTVRNCYSIGTAASSGGGLIGNNDSGTIISSYYNSGTSGKSDTGKGDPLTAAEMKTTIPYDGWDFEEVWAIAAGLNDGYPYLRSVVPASTRYAVTGVSLNKSSLLLDAGTTATLTAVISPENATNTNVTWSTSDTSVASVSNGVVTAKKAGTATITVTSADGGKTANCAVRVIADWNNEPVTSVTKTTVLQSKSYGAAVYQNTDAGKVYDAVIKFHKALDGYVDALKTSSKKDSKAKNSLSDEEQIAKAIREEDEARGAKRVLTIPAGADEGAISAAYKAFTSVYLEQQRQERIELGQIDAEENEFISSWNLVQKIFGYFWNIDKTRTYNQYNVHIQSIGFSTAFLGKLRLPKRVRSMSL